LDLEYRFEVAIISITWTALVVLGVMFAFFFRPPRPEDRTPNESGEGRPGEHLT
jgi:hypothetical protein